MFELCLGAPFFSALKESGSSCQNSTAGSSSFQGRVEPLNHIIVLILKHYYVKHKEQTDEVHFTVRLQCYTEVTWVQ